MKKSLIIVLSIMFVLGICAWAYATDVTLSGSIRVRGAYLYESDFDDSDYDSENTANYDQRVRLKVKAVVTPNTMGVIEIENSTDTSDGTTWGESSSYSAAIYAKGNAKRGTLAIRQAYILHKGSGLLGTPASFKVGHQLVKLGNGLFLNHTKFGDDGIVLLVEPQKGTEVSLVTLRLQENTTSENDDATAYVLALKHALDNLNLSADITYVDDQGFVADPGRGLHFFNIGLRGDTKAADIGLKADVEIQTGKAKGATSAADVKYKGLAVLLGADYKLGDVTVGVEGAYGSGNKIETTDKYEGFVTTQGSGFAYLYDDKVATAAISPTGTLGGKKAGLNNTQYLKLHASTEATPDLGVSGAIYILKATKKQSTAYDSKNIGTEIDAKVTYKIDKNLKYYVEGGYLIAGDLYKNQTSGRNPDNVYGVRHGILLNF